MIKTVKTAQFEMDCCVFGNGPGKLVILPGMSVRSVMGSADGIEAAYACFSATHRVFLFDRVRVMPERYSVSEMARDTAQAMRALGIAQADVFGASQGGMIALCLAIDATELVGRLVLGSTMARGNPTSDATFDRWTALAEGGMVRELNRDFTARAYCARTREAFRDVFALQEAEGTPEELRRFAVQSRAARSFDVYSRLSDIRCPVLVLGAKEDRVLSGAASLELAARLGCERYLYEDYGHAVYDEAPDYKDRLMRFFGVSG